MHFEDEFYIGYLDKAPASFGKFSRRVIIVLFILIPLLSAVLVISQRGFSTGTFEFGNLRELEGIAFKRPFPHLRIISGKDIYGNYNYQNIILLGYGKFGASGILDEIEIRAGNDLEQVVVKLSGTLIYNDGKTLFELTRRADSYISHTIDLSDYQRQHPKTEPYGAVRLEGEIIDPKCYFGVMKPGEGKPHRSCAIRCISGGIPPMLAVRNASGESNYYVLLGENGEAINQQVLEFVAEPVSVSGKLESLEDCLILKVNPVHGIQRVEKLSS
jgi:hypothetical protein